jgi:hypothetical protein
VKTAEPNGVVVARGGAACGYALYVMDGVAKFGIHRTSEGPTFVARPRRRWKTRGLIDEVKIFRAALSPEEINEQAEIEK